MKPFLFEVSWDICNASGGVATVIQTKAQTVEEQFDHQYVLIGPMVKNNPYFSEDSSVFPELPDLVSKRNLLVKTGHYNVPGQPKCILVDYHALVGEQDQILYQLWDDFGVDSMLGQWDYVEPLLFSIASGIIIEKLLPGLPEKTKKIAHFHEWLSGGGLLYLKKNLPEVVTVFTAHATVLGRAMANYNENYHQFLDEIEPLEEAKKYNISAKFSLESVCAREADCFTTISDISAGECQALLGISPKVTTYNGFDLPVETRNQLNAEFYQEKKRSLLVFSEKFLNREFVPDKTKLILLSGRYEFHNKGIDIFLESLAATNQQMIEEDADTQIIAMVCVTGGCVGIHEEIRLRIQNTFTGRDSTNSITTHYLSDMVNDPIVNQCQRLNLMNAKTDKVNIIFVPADLDGNDGVLNIRYYDLLAGVDLGCFPSHYDPWSYTPHESIAFGVPTITSDKTGFGSWVQDQLVDHTGIEVLKRYNKSYEDSITALTQLFAKFRLWSNDDVFVFRENARQTAEKLTWKNTYSQYEEAYEKALSTYSNRIAGLKTQEETRHFQTFFSGINSIQPHLRSFSVVSNLPEAITRLTDLAHNVWWSWNPSALDLFRRLDPVLWETISPSPVAMLQKLDRKKLEDAAQNEHFLTLYRTTLEKFDHYLEHKKPNLPNIQHITAEHPVAYFSMEYGIHESLPIYSGGLGILSGDHIKSASDINIPLVAIGLMYKRGYFMQRINKACEQVAYYQENPFGLMPIELVKDANGLPLLVRVGLPGRQLSAQVWKLQAGRNRLLLMDTDIDANTRKDRDITERLYNANTTQRIEQEILLGIGGVRLLGKLAIEPSVYHLNEGHSAFLLVELINRLMRKFDFDFATAKEVVKNRTVFTTHTPVPAGNENFEQPLIENYFRSYIEKSLMTWEQFWNLGHVYAEESSNFQMTVLALKMTNKSNGVSQLHGAVSREMWKDTWKGFLTDELPIGAITNGVHYGTWIATELHELFETYCSIKNDLDLLNPPIWNNITNIPNQILWKTHKNLKRRLFDMVLQVVQEQWIREGENISLFELFRSRLNREALTVTFARRFATYKRPELLFNNIETLKSIIDNESRPVIFIFSGKAHPADTGGRALIQQIAKLAKQPEYIGKIIFLENYSIKIARFLVSGSDVWLNNPIRPMEASGTSGMKAAMNGVPNCSILDGWWEEGYGKENGWAIGDGTMTENRENQNIIDSGRLYHLLENEIIPMFYTRNHDNLPEKWMTYMKNAMITSIPVFNSHRMFAEYVTDCYEPVALKTKQLAENNYERAHDLAQWKKKLPTRFPTLHIKEIQMEGLQGNQLNFNNELVISVHLELGRMEPAEILTELFLQNQTNQISYHKLEWIKQHESTHTFQGGVRLDSAGEYRYGIRVIPVHADLTSKCETGLVYWG